VHVHVHAHVHAHLAPMPSWVSRRGAPFIHF